MAELSVLIPGLLGPLAELQEVDTELPDYSILSRWLSCGQRIDNLPSAYLPTLACLLAVQSPPSVAELSALQDQIVPGRFFLRADPVHFKTQMDHAILLDQHRLDIGQQEAAALVESFNQHFAQDGLRLHFSDPTRWYLEFPTELDLHTTPLDQAIARNVHNFLPVGEDARHWRSILNEAQMLFHGHQVNQQRESAARPAINSLWLWGEKQAAAADILAQTPSTPVDWIMSDELLACGLARIRGIAVQPLRENLADIAGHGLLILNSVSAPLSYGDVEAWLDEMEKMYESWFVQLQYALQQGHFKTLNLYTADGRGFRISRVALLKFWRRQPWWRFVSC